MLAGANPFKQELSLAQARQQTKLAVAKRARKLARHSMKKEEGVFLSKKVKDGGFPLPQDCKFKLAGFYSADIFAVNDLRVACLVNTPSGDDRISNSEVFWAIVSGKRLATKAYFENIAAIDSSIKYKAAALTFWGFWLTPAFRTKHDKFAKVFDNVCNLSWTKWVSLTAEDFKKWQAMKRTAGISSEICTLADIHGVVKRHMFAIDVVKSCDSIQVP